MDNSEQWELREVCSGAFCCQIATRKADGARLQSPFYRKGDESSAQLAKDEIVRIRRFRYLSGELAPPSK